MNDSYFSNPRPSTGHNAREKVGLYLRIVEWSILNGQS
jgi:hypothetical protein